MDTAYRERNHTGTLEYVTIHANDLLYFRTTDLIGLDFLDFLFLTTEY
jgi:hypothetical protein